MDKGILEIVNDFAAWRGNSFTLAALVADRQKEIDRQKLIELDYADAAELL